MIQVNCSDCVLVLYEYIHFSAADYMMPDLLFCTWSCHLPFNCWHSYCSDTLLVQPPDSLLLCYQRQLRRWLINSMFIIIVIFFLSNLPFYPSDINFFASDDLACFLLKFGSFKAICQAKSHQNITAKVIVVVHFAILDAGQ